MSNSENSPEPLPEELDKQSKQVSEDNTFHAVRINAGMSAGLAFIANVESLAGYEAMSTVTLRTAGALAVGAAAGGIYGFILNRKN